MQSQQRHIAGFDALRALSVSLVILSHTGAMTIRVFNADLGVKTFFVLSGFLITTLLAAEHERTGQIAILAFMKRRGLRILPLYFLIVALSSGIMLAGMSPPTWNAVLYSALYLYNFIPRAEATSYLNHLWSLAVEEQFYVLWPPLLALLIGKSRLQLNLVILAVAVMCSARLEIGYGELDAVYYAQTWTIPAILPIVIGAGAALNIREIGWVLRSPFSAGLGLLLVCGPLLFDNLLDDLTVSLGLAGIIGWVYLNQSNAIVRNMDVGPIGYIGKISYGLYMWQGFLTGNGPYRDAAWPPPMWIGALLILPLAMLSYSLIEQPIRSLGRD